MLDNRDIALVQLCHLMVPQEIGLADEVILAATSPDIYLDQFRERLATRGIDNVYVPPILPWIALVDGLEARGHLVEINWATEASNAIWNLNRLLTRQSEEPARWDWVDLETWEYAPTRVFLQEVAEHLVAQGLILTYLDVGSDSYPLTLLDTRRLVAAQKLARQAGYGQIKSLVKNHRRKQQTVAKA